MIHSLLPYVETLSAETASTINVDCNGLPIVHERRHLATVHQPEMLAQVVFAVKRTSIKAFVLTLAIVVRFDVIFGRIQCVAVYASLLTRAGICDNGP